MLKPDRPEKKEKEEKFSFGLGRQKEGKGTAIKLTDLGAVKHRPFCRSRRQGKNKPGKKKRLGENLNSEDKKRNHVKALTGEWVGTWLQRTAEQRGPEKGGQGPPTHSRVGHAFRGNVSGKGKNPGIKKEASRLERERKKK